MEPARVPVAAQAQAQALALAVRELGQAVLERALPVRAELALAERAIPH